MLTEVKLDGTELPDVKTDVPGPRSISLAQRLAEHEARVMQSEMPESLKSFSF